MISGILAGGIPGFRIELCCFLQHLAHGDFVVFPVVDLFYGPANITHKLSSACAEMILSYHLLPQQIFFTHNWNLSRHCFVVVWLFVFVWFVFVCVCSWCCFCFCSLCFGSCSRERDKGIGLCIGPLPVYFCGHYSFGPCVN